MLGAGLVWILRGSAEVESYFLMKINRLDRIRNRSK